MTENFGADDPIIDTATDFGADDPIVDQGPANRAQAARAARVASKDVDPDRYAQARRTAELTGLSADLVYDRMAVVQERLRQRQIDTLAADAPRTTEALADPATAKLVGDDVEQFTRLERAGGALTRGVLGLAQGANATALRINQRMLADFDRVMADPTAVDEVGVRDMDAATRAQYRRSLVDALSGKIENIANLETLKRDAVPAAESVRRAASAKGLGDALSAFAEAPVEFVTTMMLESSPGWVVQLPAAVAGAALTGARVVGAAAGMGASSYATDYGSAIMEALADSGVDVRDQGALRKAVSDPKMMAEIARRAHSHAAAVAAFDAVSGGLASKALAKSKLLNLAVQTPIQGALGGAGEIAGTVATGEDIKWGSVLAEFAGEFGGAPVEVATLAGEQVQARRVEAGAATQHSAGVAALLDAAAGQKLKERAPDVLRDHVEQVTDGATVLVDGGALMQSLRAMPPEQAAAVLEAVPALRDQIVEYQQTGSDVELSLADAAAYMSGTALQQTIVEHGRSGADAPTRADAAELMQREGELMQSAAQKIQAGMEAERVADTELNVVRDRVLSDLKAAGRWTNSVNEKYAGLVAEFYNVQAARMGVSPVDLFASNPINVNAQGPTVAAPTLEQSDLRNIADMPDISTGSGAVSPRPIAAGKPLWRDTTVGGLDDLLMPQTDREGGLWRGFVTDNRDLAIGQGENTGVMVEFRPDSLGGGLHAKPGTSPETGQEYSANMVAPRAVRSVTFKDKRAMKGAQALVKRALLEDFDRVDQPDGSVRFTRKAAPSNTLRQSTQDAGQAAYEAQVDAALASPPQTGIASLGLPSPSLLAAGVPGRPLRMPNSVIRKIAGGKHDLTPDQVKALPAAISEPLLVFKSATEPGSFVLVLDMVAQDNGTPGPVLVAIDSKGNIDRVDSNVVTSAYPSASADGKLTAWVNAGLLVAAKKKTAATKLSTLWLQLPLVVQAIRRSGAINIAPGAPAVKPYEQKPTGGEARGLYNVESRTISLLEKADLSTFLHEAGHAFLEVMADLASRPGAPSGVVDDMAAVLEWAGVADLATWNGMTLEQKRDAHEQFARGFEAYLFEGKAPNAKLSALFASFRAWLMAVYRRIAALDVGLTDEIRGVFDRMLASNDDIAEQARRRAMAPMFESMEAAGMTADEWYDYQSAAADSSRDAVAAMQARSLRDMRWLTGAKGRELKRLQDTARDVRGRVEQEVAAAVEQEPVYAARAALDKAPDDQRINSHALRAMYADQSDVDLAALPAGYRSENGVHPDVLAEAYGFDSGDALVRALLTAQPFDAVVEAETDRRMLEEHAELSSDGAIQRAADEALHNAARIRFVATELKALAAMTKQTERTAAGGSVDMVLKAAKEFAEQLTARTRVRDLSPTRFAAAGARNARKAVEEQARGNIVGAAAAKRNQLLAERTAREQTRAQDEVEKARAYLRKFDNADVRKNIDVRFLDQIDQLLESVSLRRYTGKALDSRQSLREWIEAQEAAGVTPTVDPDAMAALSRKAVQEMTVEELRGLRDAVKNIEHIGRRWKKALTDKANRDFSVVAASVVDSIKDNATRTIREDFEAGNGWRDKAGRWAAKGLALHRRLSSFIREMDGSKDGGAVWQALGRPMNERSDKESTMSEAANIALSKVLSPLVKMPGGLTQKRVVPGLIVAGKPVSMSREARLSVALNWGNATNRQRLMGGHKWTEAQAEQVLATLTRDEWAAVQGVWDHLQSYWAEIRDKERRVSGVTPEQVDPVPFTRTLADGSTVDLTGGYYPIKYDTDKSSRSESHDVAQAAKDMMAGAFTRATTRRGHTKQRAEEVNRPLRTDLGVVSQHVTQVIHDLSWHEWLIDANRMLSDATIEAAIREHHGVEVLRSMRESVKTIAAGDTTTQTVVDTALRAMQARIGAATMGFSLTTALMQPFGLTQSVNRIGAKWVLSGLRHWAGDALRLENTVAQIAEKSEFMRLRAKTMNKDINDLFGRLAVDKSEFRQKADASLFYLMQKMQLIADVPTWLGAYEKAIDAGVDEAEAVARADQSVIDSQGSGRVADQARIEQVKHLGIFTQFYSYFSGTFNLMAEAFARTNFKDPRALLGFTSDMMLLAVVPAIAPQLITGLLKGEDMGDPEKLAKKLAQWQAGYLLGTVVLVRELSGMVNGFDYGGPSVMRIVGDVYKLGKQTAQGDADEGLAVASVRLVGDALGLPHIQAMRSYRGWQAWSEGRAPGTSVLFGPPPKD